MWKGVIVWSVLCMGMHWLLARLLFAALTLCFSLLAHTCILSRSLRVLMDHVALYYQGQLATHSQFKLPTHLF